VEQELQIFLDAAEQLEELKTALSQQKDASERLRSLTGALTRVSDQIARVPSALEPILAKAEAAENRLDSSARQIDAFRDSIPALVERVEQSDIGRSIDALTAEIDETRQDLRGFREASATLHSIATEFRASRNDAAKALAIEVERIQAAHATVSAAIASLQSEVLARLDNVHTVVRKTAEAVDVSASASASSFALTIGSIRAAGERHAEAFQQLTNMLRSQGDDQVSILRQELRSINEQIAAQSKLLEALSKKKGFTF
jgi:chromosome segregation ATPase